MITFAERECRRAISDAYTDWVMTAGAAVMPLRAGLALNCWLKRWAGLWRA